MMKKALSLLLAVMLLLPLGSMTAYAAKSGWVTSGGSRYYYDAKGNRVTDGLFEIDGKAYMLDADGKLVTKKGWYKVAYADESGSGESWYYLNADGTAYRGWMKRNGKRYYLAYEMVTKPINIDGAAYVFAASGVQVTKKGWYSRTYEDGKKHWWYIAASGYAYTGWHKLSGKWYYFDTFNGVMYSGGTYRTSDGKICYFKAGGAWYKPKGWQQETVTYKVDGKKVSDTYYSYFGSDGYGVTGWQKISGKWYYFSGSGIMATGWQKISGKWYYFYKSGKMATGTVQIDGKTYTFASSGALK